MTFTMTFRVFTYFGVDSSLQVSLARPDVPCRLFVSRIKRRGWISYAVRSLRSTRCDRARSRRLAATFGRNSHSRRGPPRRARRRAPPPRFVYQRRERITFPRERERERSHAQGLTRAAQGDSLRHPALRREIDERRFPMPRRKHTHALPCRAPRARKRRATTSRLNRRAGD